MGRFPWNMLLIFVLFPSYVYANGGRIKPVAVFSSEEADYHKYSAILAATEPYRLQRDDEIKKALNPLKYWFHKLKGYFSLMKVNLIDFYKFLRKELNSTIHLVLYVWKIVRLILLAKDMSTRLMKLYGMCFA